MNSDLFRGKWDEFKGDLKQEWGNYTDDDLEKIDGEYDKFMAVTLERYPGRREQISRWADDWYAALGLPVGQPAEPG
jgi:uncharacterized protein YjbJ (UPF0337 family)